MAIIALVLLPLAVATHKSLTSGIALADLWPRRLFRVQLELDFEGNGSDVSVKTYLPVSDPHQDIAEDQDVAPNLLFTVTGDGANRVGTWTAADASGDFRVRHTFTAALRRIEYHLADNLAVPSVYPAGVAERLRPEEAIQVDAPEIQQALRRIGAEQGSVTERLHRVFDFVASHPQRPFKGPTDALTALRLGEASCNGKSRLFVALARAAGLPARLVGGIVLDGESKRTSHQWAEVWVSGRWIPFCPTNHHFAVLPERYLTLYTGDEALFRHTPDINFDYRFASTASLVPSPQAQQWMPALNVWALFKRLGLSFALLRTVLMLPVGALVVVLFRNVVGMPTFGTFLPALLAAATGETGAAWGVAGVLLLVLLVALVRAAFQRLDLLHSPSLAILLTAVSTTLLGLSLLADHFELGRLSYVAVFPIAVLAITAERFYLALVEDGAADAAKQLAGTVVVMLGCAVVMNSLALQTVFIAFPEALLIVVAANVYLGRWVGLRVTEHWRFRRVLRQEAS